MALLFKSQPDLRIRVQKSVRVRHGAASISQPDQSRNWIFLEETKCRRTSQVGKSDKTNWSWQHLRRRTLPLILHMIMKENKSDYLMTASMHFLKNLCSIWKRVTCQKNPTEIEWRESTPKKNWDCHHLCWQTLESSWSKNSHSDLSGELKVAAIRTSRWRIILNAADHWRLMEEAFMGTKNITSGRCVLLKIKQSKWELAEFSFGKLLMFSENCVVGRQWNTFIWDMLIVNMLDTENKNEHLKEIVDPEQALGLATNMEFGTQNQIKSSHGQHLPQVNAISTQRHFCNQNIRLNFSLNTETWIRTAKFMALHGSWIIGINVWQR